MSKHDFHIPGKYWAYQALVYLIFFASLFLIIPVEVAEQSWVAPYTNFMASWVPMLREIQKISGYKGYLSFYYSAMWTVVPVLAFGFVAFGVHHPNTKNSKNSRISAPLFSIFWRFTFCAVLVFISLCWPVSMNSQSWRDQMIVRNVFGFIFFGFMALWAWSLWFAAGFILIERFFHFLQTKLDIKEQ